MKFKTDNLQLAIFNRPAPVSSGFTLVEVLMVVAIIGLIAAIGIPSFLNSRQSAENNIKSVNISAVNAAKEQWAIMNNKAPGATVVWTNIAAYIGGGITNQAGLNVPLNSTNAIIIGNIGTSARY
jgi:type IV pilus assembly protein PilA